MAAELLAQVSERWPFLRRAWLLEERRELGGFVGVELDVFARLAAVGITLRLRPDLAGESVRGEVATAREELGDLERLVGV
jgi:hypothetical protein